MPEKTRWEQLRRLGARLRRRPIVGVGVVVVAFFAAVGSAWGFFSHRPAWAVLWPAILDAARLLSPIEWAALAVMLVVLVLLLIVVVALFAPQPVVPPRVVPQPAATQSPPAQAPPAIDEQVVRRIANQYVATLQRSAARHLAALQQDQDGPDEPEARKVLRERHSVRPLRPFEVDLEIGRLPGGVFGFTGAVGLEFVRSPITIVSLSPAPGLASLFEESTVTAKLRAKHAAAEWRPLGFEFHKLADGRLLLVGFTSAADALRVDDWRSASVWFHTRPWGEASTISIIDSERVTEARLYDTADATAKRLELTLAERPSSPSPAAQPSSTAS